MIWSVMFPIIEVFATIAFLYYYLNALANRNPDKSLGSVLMNPLKAMTDDKSLTEQGSRYWKKCKAALLIIIALFVLAIFYRPAPFRFWPVQF
jgi:uncharacterized ion transporter superfamily protein YfcC